jgi:hypothetical protein
MALIVLDSAAMDASIAAKTAETIGPVRLLRCSLRLLIGALDKLGLS